MNVLPAWAIMVALCGEPALLVYGDDEVTIDVITRDAYLARVEPASSRVDAILARTPADVPVIDVPAESCTPSI